MNSPTPSRRILLVLALAAALTSPIAVSPQTPAATVPPPSPSPQPQEPSANFFRRLAGFYRADWYGTAPASPPAPRRGVPSPLNSPPFPSADWSYGGSPTIGESDGNVYPLQTAINGATGRTKVYGWVEPTGNLSTSRDRNYPETNDIYSNRIELGQAVVYLERLPDSVQRDHIDWGFHLTAFYGTDYRSTTNKGYFSSQLLDHNRQYGFDPVLEYLDIYFPHVAQGMNLRIGRYISIPGIEAQLTPNNYMFSHSLLYAVDPFTDTGILATIQVNDRWTLQAGLSASHDVAPWTPDAKPAFTGCASYTTASVNDNFYLCANGLNDGEYAFNNLQMYDATWYRKFGSTWHMATESYSMYQRDVPSINGTIAPEKGTNGANCRPGEQKCLAPEWAVINYLNKQLSPHSYLSFRSDMLNDKKGQRTGHATRYNEATISFNRWIGNTIQIRPELRFDHAWDRRAYDEGRRTNQLTFSSDVIFHF
jgi:hypothetical protein